MIANPLLRVFILGNACPTPLLYMCRHTSMYLARSYYDYACVLMLLYMTQGGEEGKAFGQPSEGQECAT